MARALTAEVGTVNRRGRDDRLEEVGAMERRSRSNMNAVGLMSRSDDGLDRAILRRSMTYV